MYEANDPVRSFHAVRCRFIIQNIYIVWDRLGYFVILTIIPCGSLHIYCDNGFTREIKM